MVTKRYADVLCKNCKQPMRLREYIGIPGGIYGGCTTKGCRIRDEDDRWDFKELKGKWKKPTKKDY